MTRRRRSTTRPSRPRATPTRRATRKRAGRLPSAERILFVLGALLYAIGLFGSIGLVAMPPMTAIVLLALGGGMLLALALIFVF